MTDFPASLSTPAPAADPVPLPKGRRRTELLMLAFALAVVAFADAAVGLGLNGNVPASLIGYVGGFALIMVGAHFCVRWLAPWADPLMLPLAALLNGLGVVMIYRLQESGRNGNPGNVISTLTAGAAGTQLVWTLIGVIGFIAVLFVIREPRVLQRYTYTLGALGLILLAIPALLPEQHELGAGRQGLDHHRRVRDPARRVRQAGPGRVLRRLPGQQAGRAGPGGPPAARHRPAARPGPRAGADRLGRQPADPGLRDRHRHVGDLLRAVRGDDLRRDPADLLAADRLPAVPGRRLGGQHAVQPRRRPVHRLAAPVHAGQHQLRRPHRHGLRAVLPARAGPVRDGLRRHLRQRARPRPAVLDAAGAERLHHHRRSARNSA